MSRRGRWIICIFIFFATVLNYMDRQTLSIVAPLVQQEFGLDNAQLGLLFSAFYFSYGIGVALIGEVIDRISVRIALAFIVGAWSLATALTALSRTLWHLFSFRMLLGVAEAGNWPTTARLVSMYIAPGDRTLANSIYMGGGSVGLLLVQPLLVWMSLRYGWRSGFVGLGALAGFWIVAWVIWFRPKNTAALTRYDMEPTGHAQGTSWGEVVRLPRFWGLIVAWFSGMRACIS